MLYSYAQLSPNDFGLFRLSSLGLGNLLLPWARCIVASHKYNLQPIYPTWNQVRIGAILRGEPDKKFYHDLFRRPNKQIGYFKKLYLLNTLRKISELEFYEMYAKHELASEENILVIFEGMDIHNPFSAILPDHQLVFDELLKITRNQHKKGIEYCFDRSLSIHVRLGDFSIPKNQDVLKSGAQNYRIPLSWYVHQVKQLRQEVNRDVPVYIFSDGRDNELSELLSLPNCQRISFGSSIADMLALSKSNILIASGSSFSMWASYLGRMPVIWYKGQLRQKLYYENDSVEVECDNCSILSNQVLKKLANRLV
jgi:hypothetical protein